MKRATTVSLFKANASYKGQTPILDTVIRIDVPLPDPPNTPDALEQYRRAYQQQAERLAEALMAALPQGTMHALLAELLHQYACVYKGPSTDAGPLVKLNPDGTLT